MVNKTIDAVIASLYKEFGDEYTYTAEQSEQGLEGKTFLVSMIRPTSHGGFWNTHNRVMPIVVYYFPNDTLNPRSECYSIGERALEAVNIIEIESVKVSGKDLEIQLVDNVLQIFATYDFWTKDLGSDTDDDKMEQVENETKLDKE